MTVWTDATLPSLVGFYAEYTGLSRRQLRVGHEAERKALRRCDALFYASAWAGDSAVTHYDVDPGHVVLAPFGANYTYEADSIGERPRRPDGRCQLLFVGADWARKRAAFAVDVAAEMNRLGVATDITLVGSRPPDGTSLPFYANARGFVDKTTAEGRATLAREFARADFLVLPSLAECFGIVVAEANAFAVPALVARVGGTPDAVRDGTNGYLFSPRASAADYAARAADVFRSPAAYTRLRETSLDEYRGRLNWGTSVSVVLERLAALL